MGNNHEDILWIEDILKGQTNRYALLVDKYKDTLFALTMGMLKNREEAEEVSQDIFVKIFKALPKFKQKAKFSTWMYRIAYNECISHLRKQKISTVSVDHISENYRDTERYNTGNWQEAELKSKMLHRALNHLPETERGLVHFFYFDNLPVNEIAQITGLSVSNVKTKLFRIRKKLYEELQILIEKEMA